MNDILKKVFGWMSIGLLVSFITGFTVATNPNMLAKVATSGSYLLLIIVQLVLVIVLSARVTKMNPTTARIVFILYSFITGLTFSSIFVYYEISSIVFVFLITAILFGALAFVGYTTKADLSSFKTYLFVGLIGIIISSMVNIFIGSSMFEMIICTISIAVFLGYTAYDVKRIEALSNTIDEDNLAIYGALQLYLDFINLFIDLLRLFGKGRD